VRSNSVLNLDLDPSLVSDFRLWTLDLAEVDLTQCQFPIERSIGTLESRRFGRRERDAEGVEGVGPASAKVRVKTKTDETTKVH